MSDRPTPETDALECAFALLKCSPIGSTENSSEYGRAAYRLSKHCQGKEDVSEAAMRIFAERIAELERERDEARENLRILAGLVAYGLGQSGEEWSLDAMRQATETIQKTKKYELDP